MKRLALAIATLTSMMVLADGKPQSAAFRQLAPGAVKPERWLKTQLQLQADGLTGHAEDLYEDIGESDWLTRGNRKGEFQWERGPYYARGLQALAWQLDDAALKAKAKRWVEALFASQLPNGDFGPKRENWWANMLALYLVRDWYLISGDPRCVDFVRRYAAFQKTALLKKDLHGDSVWACARGGDGMEVFLDFYDRTGEKIFLEAAELYYRQTAAWTDYYRTGAKNISYQEHIVNFNEGLKTPALAWRLTGSEKDKGAYAAAMAKDGWSQLYAGRPDRMQNGEEPLSGRNASGGTELCAQAERLISCADQVSVLANVEAADDLETVAYNCLPATLSPDVKGLRYYLPLNCPKAVDEPLFYAHNNHAHSLTPSPHAGFGCCRSNFHIAWPKFVQSMWMASNDGGLAAVAYGPCTVTAKVGGRDVSFRMITDYPFRSQVTLEMIAGAGDFPLHVRIPTWAKGEKDAGSFRTVRRNWKAGDRLTFDFAAPVTVEKGWSFDAACIRRGPLLFAFNVPAKEKVTKDYGNGFVTRELRPRLPWNVALLLPEKGDPAAGVTVVDDGAEIAGQPFEAASAPVRLRMLGCRTDEVRWGHFRYEANGTCVEPPPSPIRAPGEPCALELVPLGCTQTRVTLFPWGTAGDVIVPKEAPAYGRTLADGPRIAASHCYAGDSTEAVADGVLPINSGDESVPRFTTWDHKGGTEWVSLVYPKARRVSSVSVYWFEDGKGCAVPKSWKLQAKGADGLWSDLPAKNGFPVVKDAFSRTVLAKPVMARDFRLVIEQDSRHASGILEARLD